MVNAPEDAYKRARTADDFSGFEEAYGTELEPVAPPIPSVITVPADIERQVRTVLAEDELTLDQKLRFLGSNFLPSDEGNAVRLEILKERATGSQRPGASWAPQDLTDVLALDYEPPRPTFFTRTDGHALFYPGVVNEIHMEAGGGKTWVALALVSERLRLGERVLYIDHEEHRGRVAQRLLSLGLNPELIREGFHYVQPETTPTEADVANLCQAGYSLVVVDTVGESIRLVTGGDSNSTDDVTVWHGFARAFARTGSCVLVIDHITKSADNPLFPIGSQAKYAGYKGAVYLLEAPTGGGLAEGSQGYLSMKLAKDNGGGLGLHKGDLAAEFHLDATGSISAWELRSPDASTQVARAAQAALSQRTRLLDAVPAEGITKGKLREAVGVKGNNFAGYSDAFEALIESGELVETPGPNNSKIITAPSLPVSPSIGTGETGRLSIGLPSLPKPPGGDRETGWSLMSTDNRPLNATNADGGLDA